MMKGRLKWLNGFVAAPLLVAPFSPLSCFRTGHHPEVACLSQCELRAASCGVRAIEEFDDYETALARWRESAPCRGSTVAGRCEEGLLILHVRFSEGAETHYFDPDTGAFVGIETLTDGSEPPCFGVGYWPVRTTCTDPVVTENICRSFYEIGDVVPLDY